MWRFIKLTGIIFLIFAAVLVVALITDIHFNDGGSLIPIGQDYDTTYVNGNDSGEEAVKDHPGDSYGSEPAGNSDVPGISRYNSGFSSKYKNVDVPQEQKPEAANSDMNEDEFIVTLDELNSLGKIGFADKIAGLMIIRKIDKTGISRLLKIARSGVTSNELEDVKAIFDSNLDEKDMKKLYGILMRNNDLFTGDKVNAIISSLGPVNN